MSDISDFKNYKKAKVYVEHITAILQVLNLTIAGLKLFSIYTSVQNILVIMKEEKKILEAQLRIQKEVINNKGKK